MAVLGLIRRRDLIHLAAVGIAGIAPVTEAETITISTGFHDVVLADVSEPDATELTATPLAQSATTPAPEEELADAAEPITPIAESEVPEEQATPPPIRRTTTRKPPQRLIRVTSATPGAASVAKSARRSRLAPRGRSIRTRRFAITSAVPGLPC